MASSESELSRTAWRSITASNQPGRRRRPVLVPYSRPTSTKWSPEGDLRRIDALAVLAADGLEDMASSVGNGPVPTRVT